MYAFCTYFDGGYLARGLALYESLAKHCGPFRLWVLCFDDACYDALTRLRLPHVESISVREFERGDLALAEAKRSRTTVEYYFTCTPSLPLFLLRRQPELGYITYLDADLWFFADPAPLFGELGDRSIGIIPHRFPPRLRRREVFGHYNVGWLTFRNDAEGVACLESWRAACNEWCYDRLEAGRFADQKYLDSWPARFSRLAVLEHLGANVAPWNVPAHYVGSGPGGEVLVGGRPLIFYHFHRLRQVSAYVFDSGLAAYGTPLTAPLRDLVYLPYARRLLALERELRALGVRAPTSARRRLQGSPARRILTRLAAPVHRLYHRHVLHDHFVA